MVKLKINFLRGTAFGPCLPFLGLSLWFDESFFLYLLLSLAMASPAKKYVGAFSTESESMQYKMTVDDALKKLRRKLESKNFSFDYSGKTRTEKTSNKMVGTAFASACMLDLTGS